MEGERVFKGSRMQRGYGLGGFFASLFRRAIPLFKKGGKYLAKKAAKTGMNTVHDIAIGVNPRTAVKRRIADASDEMLEDVKKKIRRTMTGGGRKTTMKKRRVKRLCKKRPKSKKTNGKKRRNKKKRTKVCKRKIKDIFEI